LNHSTGELVAELAGVAQECGPEVVALDKEAGQQITDMLAVMYWIGEQLIFWAVFGAISVEF
jgi:hypothetical protein